MSRCRYLPSDNPEWDSLLTEEEKEFLRETQWSINLRRLPAEAVKQLVAMGMKMLDEARKAQKKPE